MNQLFLVSLIFILSFGCYNYQDSEHYNIKITNNFLFSEKEEYDQKSILGEYKKYYRYYFEVDNTSLDTIRFHQNRNKVLRYNFFNDDCISDDSFKMFSDNWHEDGVFYLLPESRDTISFVLDDKYQSGCFVVEEYGNKGGIFYFIIE